METFVEKGIYQLMSDGTKTYIPFGITKREKNRVRARIAFELIQNMVNDTLARITAGTGITVREIRIASKGEPQKNRERAEIALALIQKLVNDTLACITAETGITVRQIRIASKGEPLVS